MIAKFLSFYLAPLLMGQNRYTLLKIFMRIDKNLGA